MRLDKYLKVSRLIKRRTVANEACDSGRVLINDKPAKASANVKEGDIITISFGNKEVKVEVLDVQETVKKEAAKELTSRYLAAMNGGSDAASQSAAEAITEEMVAAMTDSMPLRSLCSFGGFSRAEIQEMIDKLQAIYSNPLK